MKQTLLVAVLLLRALTPVTQASKPASDHGVSATSTSGFRTARYRIEQLITASGADVAVAFRTLDGRDELLIQPDMEFHAASTMKVPVMIELFRQVRAGGLRLDDRIPVVNEFHSIVDGSVFRMNVSDDSDAEVYRKIGGAMSYRDLCEAMITVSSNFAANLLIERLTARAIQKTVDALGASGMQVLRGVEDDEAFRKGLNNSTTARAGSPAGNVWMSSSRRNCSAR